MDEAALQRLRSAFDPERFRQQGHDLVDRLADYLGAALTRQAGPVLPWVDPEGQLGNTPSISEDAGPEVPEIVGDLLHRAFHLHDPRTLGHQDGLPVPAASLAGLLISTLNNDPSVYETGPAVVPIEVRLLRWMCDELGFPGDAGGVLTGGGSLGNLTALLAARQAKVGRDSWTEGSRPGEALCVLVSEQAHYCVARAVQIMGWGEDGFVKVPVTDDFRMDVTALPAVLARARDAGRRPIAVVASACTTATGTFDPLPEIAEFCSKHDLWMHVDGAHGASTVLSPRYRSRVRGIERADSVVWDCHKMMMTPAVLTGVLFRNARHSYDTFRQEATYLFEERPDEEWYNPGNRTVECTRSGMAVLLYTALRVHGVGLFRDYVTRCFDVARSLSDLIDASPDFELAVEPDANIVCFRYRGDPGIDSDRLQSRLRQKLVSGGSFYLTEAELGGNQFLRCTAQNPFTGEQDLCDLLDHLRAEASALEERSGTTNASGLAQGG
jgi:L-2,4-diaminobutyrate decarboxylase